MDAGATVNRVSKADVESKFPEECGIDGLIELMACEEVVMDRASIMSCFSFACVKHIQRMYMIWLPTLTSKARAKSDATVLEGG